MGTAGRTWLIYNGASGSHDDAALDAIVAALSESGYPADKVLDCREAEQPDADEIRAAGVGTLVVHGGDGTINRTIAAIEGFGGAVLLLPGGTANLLSREVFGERAPLEIVGLLGRGGLAPRRRNCIRGRGTLALVELLAGPGATWADVREEIRDFNVGEVIAKGWDAAAMSAVGPMVRITQPAAGRADGYAGVRLTPGPAGIAIQGYGAEGLGDLVQQGVAILKRDFRDGPHDELGESEEVTCRSTGEEPIPLMVDGERCEGAAEERFSLAPLDVDLLGPANGR
jgi:hypothetical protein